MKRIFSRNFLIALFLMSSTCVSAQMDSLIFETDHHIDTASVGELRLNVDGLFFFRDNEYKGNLVKGYTLPGFHIQPTLSYQPLRNLRMEAGLYMLHYWGAEKYPNLNYSDMPEWKGDQTQKGFHIVPFFNVQLALSPHFNLLLGSIYGRANHHLIEPLYNQETGLSGDPETGLQVLWDNRVVDVDAWLNWESFIFNNDQHQESFTFGISSRFKVNRPQARAHVYFPVQVLMQHRGGEINPDAASRVIKTWMNGAAGVGVTFNTGNPLLTRVNLEGDLTYYKQMAGSMLPFDNGHGFYVKTDIDLWRFRLHGAYWHGNDFITVFGNPLYGTVGINDRTYTMRRPNMVNARVSYAQDLGHGFAWGIHADVYNHLPADAYSEERGAYREKSGMSVAAGVYLRVNPSFLLKRFAAKRP